MSSPWWLPVSFQIVAILLFLYAAHHFSSFGYRLYPLRTALVFSASLGLLLWSIQRRAAGVWVLGAAGVTYVSGQLLQIASFPLNYLRSDMLPVILWADTNLLHGTSPYRTIHVASRLYDFPYLPGMLMAYLPFVALHLDVRLGSVAYLLLAVGIVFRAARPEFRGEVAWLLSLFLLCPFLQYRHDLYLQPHWFTLAAAFVLMQRRRFSWAAAVFGISMAVYQFSWVMFPFFLLNSMRRRGWREVGSNALLAAGGALLIAGPFLHSALGRISNNTVGQWAMLPHAIADPINLSYWATFLVSPSHLLRLQAVLMVGIFGYCFFAGRCRTLTDTLRWMIIAVTVFVMFNVIVDGYFYLMILVLALLYTCVANGWWTDAAKDQSDRV